MKKLTTNEFVKKAIDVHGNKYDYSKVDYKNSTTKVTIICNSCGFEFAQRPAAHLFGQGCPICSNKGSGERLSLTRQEFVNKAIAIHGNKYDYSKVVYENNHTKVCIVCKECGRDFWQTPHNHLNGQCCPWCSGKKKDTIMFIKELKDMYGDKFSYEDVVYVNQHTLVKIHCLEHGTFEQKPKHLLNGISCPACSKISMRKKLSDMHKYTQDDFIRISRESHNEEYDYSKSVYVDSRTKVCITCPNGHTFWQTAGEHMRGQGCPKCKGYYKTTDELKEQLRAVHGDTYVLDKVEYLNAHTKVCVTCKEHGDFYALPSNLLSGQGCPMCHKHKGELRVEKFLNERNIEYLSQYEFKNESLFIPNKVIRVDFYLPVKGIVIEYNGGQHYFSVDLFGGQKKFEQQQERDHALRQYCNEHGIKLVEIPYTKFKHIEKILEKELKLRK